MNDVVQEGNNVQKRDKMWQRGGKEVPAVWIALRLWDAPSCDVTLINSLQKRGTQWGMSKVARSSSQ